MNDRQTTDLDQPELMIRSVDLSSIVRLAESLVKHIPTGTTIGLVGTLGAGKTTLAQSVAKAAGIDVANVTSPTFTLLQTHLGSIKIHHLDAYRIKDEDEFFELGVEELFEDQTAWTMIEWADRMEHFLPSDTLWIRIDIDPQGQTRTVNFRCEDSTTSACIQKVVDDFAASATDQSE